MEGVDREGLTEKVSLSKVMNEAGEPIVVGAFRWGLQARGGSVLLCVASLATYKASS